MLAPKRSYLDGLPMIAWREHDRRVPYRVCRVELLRTTLAASSRGRLQTIMFVAGDLWIRLRTIAVMLRLIHRHRIRTVCVGELLSSGWLLTFLHQLRRLGVPLRTIVYVHGEEITTEDGYDPGSIRRRGALAAADRIVVVSRFTQHAVQALLGEASADRISLIENGVDTTRFRPGPPRPDLVDRYSLRGCFVFVTVCRLLEKKGVDQAIRAFALLAAHTPELRYLIVGTGPYESQLRGLASESCADGRILFAGKVSEQDLVDHYRLGHVFVMPNREMPNGDTEGFGLVFLEANSCGLPVIAGQDGGSTDAVSHEVNGLLVDGRSVEDVAGAMWRLFSNAELRMRLVSDGLERARSSGWEEKSRALLGLSV